MKREMEYHGFVNFKDFMDNVISKVLLENGDIVEDIYLNNGKFKDLVDSKKEEYLSEKRKNEEFISKLKGYKNKKINIYNITYRFTPNNFKYHFKNNLSYFEDKKERYCTIFNIEYDYISNNVIIFISPEDKGYSVDFIELNSNSYNILEVLELWTD